MMPSAGIKKLNKFFVPAAASFGLILGGPNLALSFPVDDSNSSFNVDVESRFGTNSSLNSLQNELSSGKFDIDTSTTSLQSSNSSSSKSNSYWYYRRLKKRESEMPSLKTASSFSSNRSYSSSHVDVFESVNEGFGDTSSSLKPSFGNSISTSSVTSNYNTFTSKSSDLPGTITNSNAGAELADTFTQAF